MTPQEQLRIERRDRFYSGGFRERNGKPTPSEAVGQARRAGQVDAAIDADRPGLRTAAAGRSHAQAELELRRRQLRLLELG